MFLLALIPVKTQVSRRTIIGIDFVVFYIYLLITSGVSSLFSLIVYALMSIFLTFLTNFIASQFKKGEQVK